MRGLFCTVLLSGLLAGCQSNERAAAPMAATDSTPDAFVAPTPSPIQKAFIGNPVEMPATRPAVVGTVALTGDIQHAGPRDLCGGEKISDILRTAQLSTPASKLTVVLVRRCPEGTTSEMIDIDQNLAVLDARRDYALRDGDELVVSVAPSMPEGLARPVMSDLPPAH